MRSQTKYLNFMRFYKNLSGYQFILSVLPVIVIILILSGCSSREWYYCYGWDPVQLKAAFEKVEYDSSSHEMNIEGTIFAEYNKNKLFPAITVIAYDWIDSLKEEGSIEHLLDKHEPLVIAVSWLDGKFKIKGKFTEDMVLYIHYPGYISLKYKLKNLLRTSKELENFY